MNHKAAALLVLTAFAVACRAAEEPAGREDPIVGGTPAAPSAWPGVVSIQAWREHRCGGTLVADRWVLTAAHCIDVTDAGVPDMRDTPIIVGRQRLSSDVGEVHSAKRAIRHPGYIDGWWLDDIAVIELNEPSSASRAKLVNVDQMRALRPADPLTVVGWGRTSYRGERSDDLLEAEIRLFANDECRALPKYDSVTENQICAGLREGGRSACNGDSGGPLYLRSRSETVQVGIVSGGQNGCAAPSSPVVFTNVARYLPWLAEVTDGAVGRD